MHVRDFTCYCFVKLHEVYKLHLFSNPSRKTVYFMHAKSSNHQGQEDYFFLFMFAHVAYGSSPARHQIGAAVASLHHSHGSTRSKQCLTYTMAHSNAESLTH